MPPRHKVKLQIKPTSELSAHEEIVGSFADELVSKIKREGIQRDPILIDERTGVVLDGMHRLAAFKKLGIPAIVVCSVDYQGSGVKLFRWCRAVSNPGRALFERLRREMSLQEEGAELGRAAPGRLVLVYGGKAYASTRAVPMREVPDAMRRFDRVVAEARRRPEFLDEAGLEDAIRGGSLVLLTPRFQKRHVIEAGRSGTLLPPKSTLHVFPLRPLGIDFPLEYLRTGKGTLEAHLAGRKQKVIQGPASHGGRLYREPILVLE